MRGAPAQPLLLLPQLLRETHKYLGAPCPPYRGNYGRTVDKTRAVRGGAGVRVRIEDFQLQGELLRAVEEPHEAHQVHGVREAAAEGSAG